MSRTEPPTFETYAEAWDWIEAHYRGYAHELEMDDLAEMAMDGFEVDLWEEPAREAAYDWLDGIRADFADES